MEEIIPVEAKKAVIKFIMAMKRELNESNKMF